MKLWRNSRFTTDRRRGDAATKGQPVFATRKKSGTEIEFEAPFLERSIAKQGEHSDVFSDHLVKCFFFLALFVVVCWISWCLMCFPLVLDGVWLFFWLVVDCFWWSLMVIDWCLMVFDGRVMFLLICFDGFSMVFQWFLMLRDGVWSASEGELRWWFWMVRGDSDGSTGGHHGFASPETSWKSVATSMEKNLGENDGKGTFAKNFLGAKTWQTTLKFEEFPNFKAHVGRCWKSNVKTKSGLIPYDVLSLFTSFHMICWSSANDVLLGLSDFRPLNSLATCLVFCRWNITFIPGVAQVFLQPPDGHHVGRGWWGRWYLCPLGWLRGLAGARCCRPGRKVGGTFLEEKYGKVLEVDELDFTLKLSSKINLMMSVEKSTWQLNAA